MFKKKTLAVSWSIFYFVRQILRHFLWSGGCNDSVLSWSLSDKKFNSVDVDTRKERTHSAGWWFFRFT